MSRSTFLSIAAAAVAAVGLAVFAAGCGDSSTGPAQPPPLDISTPQGALIALEEYYGQRKAAETIALLAPGYRFFPAEPESIAFLGTGETWWDRDREVAILNELLVPERSSWIDQVLLEVTTERISVSPDEITVEVEAKVELALLIGADMFEKAISRMVLNYIRDGNDDYLLIEEHESLFTDDQGVPLTQLTVGEHKAAVLLGPGGGL